MKIANISFLIIVALLNFSCNNSNQQIEKYNQYVESNKNPIFSIDHNSKSKSKNIYKTYDFAFFNDSMYSANFSIFLKNKKIFAELNEPKSNVFILFDLNSKLNSTRKIVIKNSKPIRTFDCVLEQIVKTKQNIEVYVFRIKKWGEMSDFFGGGQVDLTVFVTEKYGVIGSYFITKDIDNREVRSGVYGDILKDYINYSAFDEVVYE